MNRPRYITAAFWLFAVLPVYAVDKAVVCNSLKTTYANQGFLGRKKMNSYCANGCEFMKYDCDVHINVTRGFFSTLGDDISKYLHDFSEGKYDAELGNWTGDVIFTDDVKDAAFEQMERISPLLLSVVPILLNQFKYTNIWFSVFLFLISGLCFGLFGFTPAITFHNMLVTYVCLVYPSSSPLLSEVYGAMIFMLGFMVMMLVQGLWLQLTIAVACLFAYGYYIKLSFFVKRSGGQAGVVVMIAQFFVLLEHIYWVRKEMAAQTLGTVAVEAVLSTVYPYGESPWEYHNVLASARSIVIKLDLSFKYKFPVFIFLIAGQVFMFFFFRACLGAFTISSLRYKFDPDTVTTGFFVYMSDVVGPFSSGWDMLWGIEKTNYRRWMYVVVCSLLTLSEAWFAREFFLARLFCTAFDRVFIDSKYGRMTKYLGESISMNGIVFPKEGSAPWISLDKLRSLSKNVHKIVVNAGDISRKGICFVNGGDKSVVVTASHVVDCMDTAEFNGIVLHGGFAPVGGDDDDPIVSAKVPALRGSVGVDVLVDHEIGLVENLAVLTVDDEDEPMINFVSGFSWKRSLEAKVDLKKGDSGSPVFAILKDGSVRLAGVVSKGTNSMLRGNIISSYAHSAETTEVIDSSDDEETAVSARRFNKDRGRNVAVAVYRYNIALKEWYEASKADDRTLEQGRDDDPEAGGGGKGHAKSGKDGKKFRAQRKEKAMRRAGGLAYGLKFCSEDEVNEVLDYLEAGGAWPSDYDFGGIYLIIGGKMIGCREGHIPSDEKFGIGPTPISETQARNAIADHEANLAKKRN